MEEEQSPVSPHPVPYFGDGGPGAHNFGEEGVDMLMNIEDHLVALGGFGLIFDCMVLGDGLLVLELEGVELGEGVLRLVHDIIIYVYGKSKY